jgi:hypothetical protein
VLRHLGGEKLIRHVDLGPGAVEFAAGVDHAVEREDHGAADVPARGEALRQAGEDETVALPEELRLGDAEALQIEPQLEAVAHAVGDEAAAAAGAEPGGVAVQVGEGGGGQGLGRQVRVRAADEPRHEQERDKEQGAGESRQEYFLRRFMGECRHSTRLPSRGVNR